MTAMIAKERKKFPTAPKEKKKEKSKIFVVIKWW
jgi:hypothetical protein